LVRLSRKNLPSRRPSDKLDDRFSGPYEILEKLGPVTYRLKLPPTMRIHDVFHVCLLEPWHTSTFPSKRHAPPPPPEIIDGTEEYQVADILDSRIHRRELQYFVTWVGYDKSDDSWVDASDFDHDDALVLKFHRNHPSRPCTPARRRVVDQHMIAGSRSQERGLCHGAQARCASVPAARRTLPYTNATRLLYPASLLPPVVLSHQ
jgi:hypothetical protein